MPANFNITFSGISKEEGYRVFTLLVGTGRDSTEFKIYAFDKDIPFKEADPSKDMLKQFAIEEMKSWIGRSGDNIPQNKFLVLMNGGKVPTDDVVKTILSVKENTTDLIRTNVTISAPLFQWAKAKAQKENTSFSDLVSRGLLTLKDSDKEIEAWFKEQGAYFRKKLGDFGSYEVFHYLPNNYTEFSTDMLNNAIRSAELHRTGWPIGAYLNGGEVRPQPQEDGIKAEYIPTGHLLLDYWYAKNKGEFYFARNLESDSGNGQAQPKTALYFDTLVWRVAEALEHCLSFYSNLGVVETERVKVKISLYGINNRSLSAWNQMRAFTLSRYVCSADKSSWEMETTLQALKENLDFQIYEVIKKLLVMFDFFVPNKEVVLDILNREYRKSQM